MTSAFVLGALLATQPASPTIVDRIEQFCVATEMQRDAFDRIASEQGLERMVRVVRSMDDVDQSKWETMFGDRTAQFQLSGTVAGGTEGDYCAVMVATPSDDWRAAVESLAMSLNMQPVDVGQSSANQVRESRTWTTIGAPSMSLVYKLYGSSLVVSLERPATD